tara:strand:- start:753 stop:1379 length:627 start_codon:yes stop_codon:yes gene_type:complete
MLRIFKKKFLSILFVLISYPVIADENPYIFIDNNAQLLVKTLQENKELFKSDPVKFEDAVKVIYEPIIDFRRVSASVMVKKYYFAATADQRKSFQEIFKQSLLDTYAETLAQWDDQIIETIFPDEDIEKEIKNAEVKQLLITSDAEYPIIYKLRWSNGEWKIINIIINGVNLGLTFRNQFKALADQYNENMSLTIANWVSDAGNAGIE